MDIGNAKSNIERLSTESRSDLDRHRREVIEAKLYYLRHTNSPEEFDYVVEAEMRRGEAREFGLPAKELGRRMKTRVKNAFKSRGKDTPTIYEHLGFGKSVRDTRPACITKSTPAKSMPDIWTVRNVLKKTHGMPVCKQTWENSPQGLAAAMLLAC